MFDSSDVVTTFMPTAAYSCLRHPRLPSHLGSPCAREDVDIHEQQLRARIHVPSKSKTSPRIRDQNSDSEGVPSKPKARIHAHILPKRSRLPPSMHDTVTSSAPPRRRTKRKKKDAGETKPCQSSKGREEDEGGRACRNGKARFVSNNFIGKEYTYIEAAASALGGR
ncbi:hypothetical protein AC578_4043 [Pseudocercospora eumusae]|uniref:Uncharacterized protein n=1 Tax=Pseudocercospora eumusae TaxID=321146 RepID=A0A139HDV3_9PEZI|nr:hypothetical protein AC578_4043 [Pseudocercospora eumusae]